ncbi:hypothetical protein K501DRAFT_336572 [Backusella circina FSU 941]|nr:hypothetical protein K501DRAFT_336572 [Backusella circina FSU 941]
MCEKFRTDFGIRSNVQKISLLLLGEAQKLYTCTTIYIVNVERTKTVGDEKNYLICYSRFLTIFSLEASLKSMIISTTLPSLPPLATTATTTTATRPSMTSTLSSSDRSLIDFTRCLYKAKAIVNELETFSMKVMPALIIDQKQYIYHNIANYNNSNSNRLDFISQVETYLGESFNRFHQMCNALLIVLKKLESREPLRRESIFSFHDELLKEWNRAESIKNELTKMIKQYKLIIHSNNDNDNNNNSETPSKSGSDTFLECQSETSPEPSSSDSY